MADHPLNGLEEGHVVPDAQRLRMWHSHGEGLRQLAHGSNQPVLAVLLGENVLLGLRQQAEALLRSTSHPLRRVEAVEEAAADLVLLEHHGDGLVLVDCGASGAAALYVSSERLLQLVCETQVVHY